MVTDPLKPLTHVSKWSRNLQTSLIVNLRFGLANTNIGIGKMITGAMIQLISVTWKRKSHLKTFAFLFFHFLANILLFSA